MKYLFVRLTVALLTFVMGVFVTFQVNRAAHYIWPDVDQQAKTHEHSSERKKCAGLRTGP